MAIARVRFDPGGEEVVVPVGTTLQAAAAAAGVVLEVPCGGAGLCRGCRVAALGEVSEPDPREAAALSPSDLTRGFRLACVAEVRGDVRVTVPDTPRHAGLARRSEIRAKRPARIGLAIDLGTTTLGAALFDIDSADLVAVASAGNPQVSWGSDVLARISAAGAGEAAAMRQSTARAIGDLARTVLGGDDLEAIEQVAVAGNTAMLHILAGQDPAGLGTFPYTAVFLDELRTEPEVIGLDGGTASVALLPGISAFVGADAVAGVLGTHLLEHEGTALLLDIGTNGEMVLKTASGELFATSAAAGPAFEGAGVECGMGAVPGAIESFWLEGDGTGFSVVGDVDPVGLCGSGLIDVVAVLLDVATLDPSGSLRVGAGALGHRVRTRGQTTAFEVVDDVVLTQVDLRQVQLAKAAVRAGAEALVERAGSTVREVDEVLVGGGFGSRLAARSLVRIGLLPPDWGQKATFVGDVVLRGVARWVCDERARDQGRRLRDAVEVVNLAADTCFGDRFLESLDFDRTQTARE